MVTLILHSCVILKQTSFFSRVAVVVVGGCGCGCGVDVVDVVVVVVVVVDVIVAPLLYTLLSQIRPAISERN